MFGFFTIALLIYYIVLLPFDGFYNNHIELSRLRVEREHADFFHKRVIEGKIVVLSTPLVIMFFVLLIELMYYGFALRHDHYVIPTILMIAHFVFTVTKETIALKKERKDPEYNTLAYYQHKLDKAKRIKHKKLWQGRVLISISILYYIYMIFMITI